MPGSAMQLHPGLAWSELFQGLQAKRRFYQPRVITLAALCRSGPPREEMESVSLPLEGLA